MKAARTTQIKRRLKETGEPPPLYASRLKTRVMTPSHYSAMPQRSSETDWGIGEYKNLQFRRVSTNNQGDVKGWFRGAGTPSVPEISQ